jgi:exopolyphosphatase/guanosine-5'-triphosphate,3'-diphosphate pyrophosphatase
VLKVAVIDLGTNTFNLLIAEKSIDGFKVLHSEKEGVAIGMGGINENKISSDAFQRGVTALVRFKLQCDKFQVQKIRAIGTSALRDATNQKQFSEEVEKLTGIQIEIISGDQEAELIYKGVKWSYAFEEKSVIMDIGGGSTEFIFADSSGILEKKSFNIGVSRIFQELQFSDPYSKQDVQQVKEWFEVKTNGFFEGKSCAILVGASGSFETFYEMIHNKEFTEKRNTLEFPQNELNQIIHWVINSTQAERDQHPFIIPIRRKMAPIAAIKTLWVMEKLQVTQTYVTPCSLKEGVLYEEFREI